MLHERYSDIALKKFQKNTERFEFLFGVEIGKYRREIIANALAVRGIIENLPHEDSPVVGGLVGYFRGSTILSDLPSLQRWFVQQNLHELRHYFRPYLDYGFAGVDKASITMSPPDLPDPPLVRCRIPSADMD